jgi:hypothetical protein
MKERRFRSAASQVSEARIRGARSLWLPGLSAEEAVGMGTGMVHTGHIPDISARRHT